MLRAKSGLFRGLNPTMAVTALTVLSVFLLFGVFAPDLSAQWFQGAKNNIISSFKWYYILVVSLFLCFALYLMFCRYGDLRLGDDDQKPEFSYMAWFSMLFSAGMGIGLIFWSIAEPIFHLQGNPFITEGGTPEAAKIAMRITWFHWGLHPWAIYSIVGLSLSFFCYRKKLPLAIRSVLYPLLGDKIYGFWGHLVDVLAVFGTVFGVATSLGLGVAQMNTGLNEVFGMSVSLQNQLILIGVISAIATLSAVSGVGKGVKLLSEFNLGLSALMLVFFLFAGPTIYIMNSFVQGIGDYLQNIIRLSFWTNAEANGASNWQSSWTAFYWGWWIAWAPFVGIFIARISKGRTVREFVLGVLLVPTLLGLFWMCVFGSTALHIQLFEGGDLIGAVNQDITSALYRTIDLGVHVPALVIVAKLAMTLLIATYFITSSDSGTLVVTTLLSVGDQEPPKIHRAIWGMGGGLVAAILLLSGGLAALQAASILAALPFSVIMLFMCAALLKGLREERHHLKHDRLRLQAQDCSPHLNLMERIGPGN